MTAGADGACDVTGNAPKRRCRLQDRPARRDLNGSDTPAVEHEESATMLAAKHTGILCQRRDDELDKLVIVYDIGILVGNVHTIATSEPHAQHYRRHG